MYKQHPELYVKKLEKILSSLDDIVFEIDKEGCFISVWCQDSSMLYLPKEQFLGKKISDILEQELATLFYATIKKVLETKKTQEIEYQSQYDVGSIYSARFHLLEEEEHHLAILVRNITERKNAQKALEQKEEQYRSLIKNSLDVITVLDENGNIKFDGFSQLTKFGYDSPNDGHSIFDFVHPDDKENAIRILSEGVKKPGITGPVEFRFRAADGSYRTVEAIGNNLLHEPSINGYVVNSRDVTERKQIQSDLLLSNARQSAIIESTDDLISAIDTGYRYLAFNKAHRRMIKKLYGINIHLGDTALLWHIPEAQQDAQHMKIFFDRSLAGEQFTEVYETHQRNGKTRYIEIAFNPIYDDSRNIIGVASFSKDITQKVLTEKELIKAKNDAIEAARTKSEFLSNMSHEIRTPINAIMGMTELLLEKIKDPEMLEYLKSIKYSSDNLLVVINDILDFSKIEAGKVNLEQIDFNIRERIDAIAKIFFIRAKTKGLDFKVNYKTPVPAFINGDPYRLNQILLNILGNAIKFTQKGVVVLNLSVVSETNQEITLCFEIQDTGIGIPEDKLETIFESFNQAYTDTTRKFGGTGLGLAITQKLTQLQNGQIRLKSKLNEGSTFMVTLPYRKSTRKTEESEQEQKSIKNALEQKKILVVEDNRLNQTVITHILHKWGVITTIANNGAEAIEKLAAADFDLVLMDLQMPEMSGYEATFIIRNKNTPVKNPNIPIIALTADAFAETKRKVLETGMNDFVSKPFDKDELYQKLVRLCK